MPPGGSTRCEHSQRQADGRHARPVMAGSWSWSWGGPFALLQRCAQSSAAPLTVLPISMRMQRSPPKARREKRDHDTSGLCARPDSRDPGPCTPSSPCVVYCTNTCQDVVEADNLTKHPLSTSRPAADQQQTSSKPAGEAPKAPKASTQARWPASAGGATRDTTHHCSCHSPLASTTVLLLLHCFSTAAERSACLTFRVRLCHSASTVNKQLASFGHFQFLSSSVPQLFCHFFTSLPAHLPVRCTLQFPPSVTPLPSISKVRSGYRERR
jgi:hypothetical protein